MLGNALLPSRHNSVEVYFKVKKIKPADILHRSLDTHHPNISLPAHVAHSDSKSTDTALVKNWC